MSAARLARSAALKNSPILIRTPNVALIRPTARMAISEYAEGRERGGAPHPVDFEQFGPDLGQLLLHVAARWLVLLAWAKTVSGFW